MLSNRLFGVDWKKSKKIITDGYESQGYTGRFGAGQPCVNDGSLLFLLHMIGKMKFPQKKQEEASGSSLELEKKVLQ